MQFSLNQTALNAAIAAELPHLLKELEFDYTSGREPKGLTADVTVTEAMIRKAVTGYARRNVSANFTHFNIEFKATRGDDGIIATVTASDQPFAEDGGAAAPAKAQPRTKAAEEPTPASEAAAKDTVTTAEVVTERAEGEGVADVATDTGAAAPFEADSGSTNEAEAPTEEAAVEKAEAATEAPAQARSKLFANLKRPDNSKQD